MEPACQSLKDALAELDRVAPEAPLLALGQTVFWDEPMKAGLALAARRLGSERRFIAGVHDTDYFAKLPSGLPPGGRFRALPHNDTTTKGLWSAAGEFSALFGGETVITRDALVAAGLRLATVQRARPNILDEATEAYGWRGIVMSGDANPITADLPLHQLLPVLASTLDWALDESVAAIGGSAGTHAQALADELRAILCDHSEDELSVADYYRRLLPPLYEFCANARVPIETTQTTELLRFNRSTCRLPRFELLDLFVRPETRDKARSAYDEAIRGTHTYELSKFGTGAIPFDVVIPGKGRGTLRLGTRGAVIMTDKPEFLSFKEPIESVADLAAAIEAKFGPSCVVVGKAVTLIGMLAREHVFVFHEGASGYVRQSAKLHRLLAEAGHALTMNPILRVRYRAWDSLRVCCSWLRLPKPLQRPFGSDELCAPSFAARWETVAQEQEALLERLGSLRRPIELIRFLDQAVGGSWRSLAVEYESLHARLSDLERAIDALRQERHALYDEDRRLAAFRQAAERAKGEHFRARIFEREPTPEDLAERERLSAAVEAIVHERTELIRRRQQLRKRQNELVHDPEVMRIHERRRAIELEAELKRLSMIREAVIASSGLRNANLRPSAWWFRLVCPDGLWFRETTATASYYLEPLA